MNDPYGVLGVSPNASDADIKKAYRELARKYHPDNYHDNPLADLAQEKMKEINEAYDAITRMRSSGGSSTGRTGSTGGYRSSSYSGSYGGSLNAIRMAINNGDLVTAERMLNNEQNRNAEWNFLMGSVYYKKGWMDDARSYFQRAVSMDPGNAEYAQAFQYVNTGGYPFRTNAGPVAGAGVDMCDMCTAMMCANMLCRCN